MSTLNKMSAPEFVRFALSMPHCLPQKVADFIRPECMPAFDEIAAEAERFDLTLQRCDANRVKLASLARLSAWARDVADSDMVMITYTSLIDSLVFFIHAGRLMATPLNADDGTWLAELAVPAQSYPGAADEAAHAAIIAHLERLHGKPMAEIESHTITA